MKTKLHSIRPRSASRRSRQGAGPSGIRSDTDGHEPALDRLTELQQIVEQSAVTAILWRADKSYSVEYVSRNISVYGYTPEDLISGRVSYLDDIIHPDDRKRVLREVMENIRNSVHDYAQEYRIRTKNGETVWLRDHTFVRRDVNQRITHFQAVLLDITDRKEAEMALRESESHFRAIFQESPIALVLFDSRGVAITANPAAKRILRTEATKHASLFESANLSADNKRDLRAGKTLHIESFVDFSAAGKSDIDVSDGTAKAYLSMVISPTMTSSPTGGYLLMAQDVTDQRNMEHQLAAVADLERERIRHALHDTVCQQLSGVAFLATSLAKRLDGKDAAVAAQIADISRRAIDATKETAGTISPNFAGMTAFINALIDMANRMQNIYGVRCRFIRRGPGSDLDTAILPQLYLLAQEAATNAAKHSAASLIEILLWQTARKTRLIVRNNGRPISERPSRTGMGLDIMLSRSRVIGWDFRIEPRKNGTVVTCSSGDLKSRSDAP